MEMQRNGYVAGVDQRPPMKYVRLQILFQENSTFWALPTVESSMLACSMRV